MRHHVRLGRPRYHGTAIVVELCKGMHIPTLLAMNDRVTYTYLSEISRINCI